MDDGVQLIVGICRDSLSGSRRVIGIDPECAGHHLDWRRGAGLVVISNRDGSSAGRGCGWQNGVHLRTRGENHDGGCDHASNRYRDGSAAQRIGERKRIGLHIGIGTETVTEDRECGSLRDSRGGQPGRAVAGGIDGTLRTDYRLRICRNDCQKGSGEQLCEASIQSSLLTSKRPYGRYYIDVSTEIFPGKTAAGRCRHAGLTATSEPY